MNVTLWILVSIVVFSLSLPQVIRKSYLFILFHDAYSYIFLCSLKPIDIVVLKKLSEVVNVVPVIAKSDSLTSEERDAFKQRVNIHMP